MNHGIYAMRLHDLLVMQQRADLSGATETALACHKEIRRRASRPEADLGDKLGLGLADHWVELRAA